MMHGNATISVWEDGSMKVISESGEVIIPVRLKETERRKLRQFRDQLTEVHVDEC